MANVIYIPNMVPMLKVSLQRTATSDLTDSFTNAFLNALIKEVCPSDPPRDNG